MNNSRRGILASISEAIGELEARLQEVIDEEQDAYDNLPESIQNGERGQRSPEAIDALDQALESQSEARSQIEEASQ